MTFDISTLDAETENTFDVPVVFNNDGEAVAGFKVVGKNSAEFRSELRRQEVTAIKRAAIRGGNQVDGKTDEGATTLQDRYDENQLSFTVACVVGLYGFSKDGATLLRTPAAVRDLFAKRPTWREKVAAAIEVEANFTKGLSKP